MHISTLNEESVTTLDNSHQSEEDNFNEEVIQDDHELYFIHHYIDSMGVEQIDDI